MELPSDMVDAVSVNSFKSRLDKHWKENMFTLELPADEVSLLLKRRSAKGHSVYTMRCDR